MARARRHQRLSSAVAFSLLALLAELVGRSFTHRVDRALHVRNPIPADETYGPFLLAGVKIGLALLLARLVWRFARARKIVRRHGAGDAAPRVRLQLSARTWAAAFAATSVCFLLETDLERVSHGRWPLLAPWLHTYALPIFAVLAVLVAVAWSAVSRWLAEYERYAEAVVARALGRLRGTSSAPARPSDLTRPPRTLFGLAFESRPPPLAA